MSLDSFIGKWVESGKEGFEQLAQTIGLPADKLEFYKQAKTEITYTRDGDQWTINVGIVGVPNGSRVFNFVMGQPYDSVNIDGTPLKSVITFEGGAFVEQHKEAGPREAEMSIVRKVNGNTMEVQTTVGGATMTSIYNKV
ncbi:fatty acid-binding protein, liver-like [Pomacea canaliculata]|uniref:fatty acid-binding protein, liver-like n=1 Tax=Pomacea canaliculata TaxID=400727 RepID=UPI000D727D78|nr:fatty acid-binding protein, liver-like [Pomacea canaliculata]